MPLGSYDRVSVFRGAATPKCCIKSCKTPPRYMIFEDDGEPMLSRLHGSSCRKHLSLAIDRAWECNDKSRKKTKPRNRK